jgi:peptide/nickel transport system substrate-binding protein
VVFATPSLLTEPWNPVAGSNWIFDMMIMRALADVELVPDPFTGLYWPQRIDRAEVTVQEGVPVVRTTTG